MVANIFYFISLVLHLQQVSKALKKILRGNIENRENFVHKPSFSANWDRSRLSSVFVAESFRTTPEKPMWRWEGVGCRGKLDQQIPKG